MFTCISTVVHFVVLGEKCFRADHGACYVHVHTYLRSVRCSGNAAQANSILYIASRRSVFCVGRSFGLWRAHGNRPPPPPGTSFRVGGAGVFFATKLVSLSSFPLKPRPHCSYKRWTPVAGSPEAYPGGHFRNNRPGSCRALPGKVRVWRISL